MARLADYFVVVGFDHQKERGGVSCGKIIQRFPEKDWSDVPFIEGIELFCQPQGWSLFKSHVEPKFFISVLTDVDANRHYLACLSFSETAAIVPAKTTDDDDPDELDTSHSSVVSSHSHSGAHFHHSIMYAPKCLVLVSRHNYAEVLRNCLGIIYTVYIESMPNPLETLVGNILGCVQVPPPGGPQVRFSIGAGDRQALQPPLCASLPVTHTNVADLFQDLGVQNVLKLFCAALSDLKIVFHSLSYSHLTEACHALTSLLYPFKYSHVFIPLLPATLIDFLSTPTPFIMGVHSSQKKDLVELLDVIVVDVDGGSITVPECITLASLPEPYYTSTVSALSSVLHPELAVADNAFPPTHISASPPHALDKQIRAIFLKLFVQLLQGYRSCLIVTRINPKPCISFHKAAFLGQRNMIEDAFYQKLLDCMFYNNFVAERGPPYRLCDIFDELYSGNQESISNRSRNGSTVNGTILELAQTLLQSENPNPQPYVQKIPMPTKGSSTRIHLPPFATLDSKLVNEMIEAGLANNSLKNQLQNMKSQQPRVVPFGPAITSLSENSHAKLGLRRLEVLHNCITYIFEGKIYDASKIFPAVVRAMKNINARHALCEKLSHFATGNQAMLDRQQFDLVVRLMNSALQDEAGMDEHGVATAILPLSTVFCRKLCTGVIQFAFTCIQNHSVWRNLKFWEAAFYQDVQKDIRALYLPQEQNSKGNMRDSIYIRNEKYQQPSALEIAAEQMSMWNSYSSDKQAELNSNEESTVYSQVIHYLNLIVYLTLPMEKSGTIRRSGSFEGECNSISNFTNSLAESDSLDAEESGIEETSSELCAGVIKFITRFVDKVCMESGVTDEHIRALHTMVPGVVAMHMETLEAVAKESKRLPPIQKIKIMEPQLLPGEICLDNIRAYLLTDGREDGIGGNFGGPAFIPAEGAIFLTSYRVIFVGIPCDSFVDELMITRSFPVASLLKEKRISHQYLAHMDQHFQEGLQMRSSTFQLMKICFDEEVLTDTIDAFRKSLLRTCNPPNIFHFFAFLGKVNIPPSLNKTKEKNATLRLFTRKGLFKVAKSSHEQHKLKYSSVPFQLKSATLPKNSLTGVKVSGPGSEPLSSAAQTPTDEDSFSNSTFSTVRHIDSKTIEKMTETLYCRDYIRMGFVFYSNGGPKLKSSNIRISTVNSSYTLCESYPALLAVPASVTDDSIKKLCKCHRRNRFPVITWRHPIKRSLLLRASSFHRKSVLGMLKTHQSSTTRYTTGANYETLCSIEQGRLISSIVANTPMTNYDQTLVNDSTLMRENGSSAQTMGSPFAKAVNSLRQSGTKGSKQFPRWGSNRDRDTLLATGNYGGTRPHETDFGGLELGLCKAALYIFGEKSQFKGLKTESYPKCDFIPLDIHEVRQIKASFKKIQRACVPSSPPKDVNETYTKLLQNSEWMNQLQTILRITTTAVYLVDVQGSSVMICLEDGWDITTQIVSLVQLCLDPYYRTLEGFRTLIEKDWQGFGHRFSHRGSHTSDDQTSGFTPVFLQFLDLVHQIHNQFPLSFEFNQYFLKFVAYHYVSCRFYNFMLDSDFDRFEVGCLFEGSTGRKSNEQGSEDEVNGSIAKNGQSIWDYINKCLSKSSTFYNFLYRPDSEYVLRPHSNVSNLKVWDYFLSESLSCGASFDLDLLQQDLSEREFGIKPQANSRRRIINSCYDDVFHALPNSCELLLKEIYRLECEIGHLPQKWKMLWENLGPFYTDLFMLPAATVNSQYVKSYNNGIHQRSAIDLLLKGKCVDASQLPSNHHRFESYKYTTLTYCDYCSNVIISFIQSGMRCTECGFNCHEQCMNLVPKNCSKYTFSIDNAPSSATLTNANQMDDATLTKSVSSVHSANEYHQFSSNIPEHRTHEGYLLKQGALLKGWKQRWFVLDSIKHQLRFYQSMEDTNCKGYIDLSDVLSVTPSAFVQGAPKRADEKAFFDIKTTRRTYTFLANEASFAHEWVEKIQACLQ
ncbi:hypothetical protein CHUAL_003867 [Chamberlinius hualienensis]